MWARLQSMSTVPLRFFKERKFSAPGDFLFPDFTLEFAPKGLILIFLTHILLLLPLNSLMICAWQRFCAPAPKICAFSAPEISARIAILCSLCGESLWAGKLQCMEEGRWHGIEMWHRSIWMHVTRLQSLLCMEMIFPVHLCTCPHQYIRYIPDCILCTHRRRSWAWIKQNAIANIVNIDVSSAWNLYGMHSGIHTI